MSLTLTQFASLAIVVLLGMIAGIVFSRLRRGGQIAVQSDFAGRERPILPTLAEPHTRVFGLTNKLRSVEMRHNWNATGNSVRVQFAEDPYHPVQRLDKRIDDHVEVQYYTNGRMA